MEQSNMFIEKAKILGRYLEETLESNRVELERATELFSKTLATGNTIFWCGNGGSASESSHLATELVGRFKENRISLPSISLNADTTAITCIANDFGYDEIYARQLQGLSKPGDLLVVLSTSGNSLNIVRALEQAKISKVHSIALLGKGGGPAMALAEIPILVPGTETARIQEVHLLIGHTLCELAEIALGF
ncbi:D-sedoheptulose-7-phosphate isomerase [Candidatus Planktophila dulcis]|uniref:D-sedoheptulose-7-phosphate isomerase n=1 Tax=Candidatus Planktophila dulcis TaxID=1884914 RepID=UPI003CE9CCDF